MRLRRPLAAWLLDVAFFAGFLAYTIFGIDPRLIYHWQAPAFYWTAEFLQHPAGILDSLYALIAQSYASRFWGGVVLTAQAVAATALARRYCRRLPLLRFLPALVVLFSANLYFNRTPVALFLILGLAGLAVRRRAVPPAARQWALAPVLVMLALAAVAFAGYKINARDRRLAALDYYTAQEDWPEVLATAAALPAADFNSLTRYEVNLALHQANRMGDEMFRFPQSESTIPPLRTETFLPYMLRITDLLLKLGRVNDAEHFGNEAMILGRSDPRVYRLLANINLAKGQIEAARKFLNILSREAGSAAWARERLAQLDRDPSVQLIRTRMLRADDMIPVWQNPEKPDADINRLLLDQLDQDPSNRMAFEFLIGNYLLARDLAGARAAMPYIKHMPYAGRTPRHYQEAMAMYADGAGQPVEIEGLQIEPDTLNRMAVFKRILSQSPGRGAAFQATWSRFRDSYFFYYVFGPGDYR